MKILIALLLGVTSVIAEPLIVKYDYPLKSLYNYRYAVRPAVYPYVPVVRNVIPSVVPAPAIRYEVPYFAGIKSQYHDQDLFGQARYGHIEPGQSHHAVQDAFGNKIGGFSYYNAEGKLKQTSYIADAAGYRVSSNDLPVDTPEVVAAKVAHLSEYEKIKYRARRDVNSYSQFNTGYNQQTQFNSGDYRFNQQAQFNSRDSRYNQPAFPHAYPTSNLEPIVTKDGFLEETPEVLAATADHFAKVADSRARIAALERIPNNDYQGQYEVRNTYVPTSHSTTSHHPSSFQSHDYRYVQPQSYQNTNGVPQDTPEVLAAKAKHFAALAANKAKAASFAEPIQQVHSPRVSISNTPVAPSHSFQPLDYQYTKPFAHAYPTTHLEPVVTRDGFLEETPEVLAAKANHFAQHAAAQARALN